MIIKITQNEVENKSTRQKRSVVAERDEYTDAIGEIGKWQIFLFLILAMPAKLVLVGLHLNIIFIAPKTTFRCIEIPNFFEEMENSTCYSDCKQYEYFSEFESSIISQWDLICDRAWMQSFAQTVCMFGVLIGSVVFGFISDRYGRRPALLISGILETLSSFVLPFCTDFWVFAVVRFFIGASTAGTMLTTFVLLMEIFGPSRRELMACIFSIPAAMGHVFMAIIVYYFKNWSDISIGAASPTLIFLTYAFCIPESPKWLISVGKLKEASVVMTTAAKWNNLPTDNMLARVEKIAEKGRGETNKRESKASFVDLFRLPSLRVKNLCSCIIWFTIGVSFSGCGQYFGQTSSNTMLVSTLIGVTEVPGIILGTYISKVFGRRVALILFSIIQGVGNGVLILPDEWYYTKLIAGSVGYSCGGAVLSLLYMYTTELFPTVARNMAISTSSILNRVGSMLAPFLEGMAASIAWAPPAVFAATPFAAVLAVCCLPETKGKKLEDHFEEDRSF